MPIYEYLCRDCDHSYEDLVSVSSVAAQSCPQCTSADVVKLYSPFAVNRGSSSTGDVIQVGGGGACMPGPASGGGGGCCGGGCGGCG